MYLSEKGRSLFQDSFRLSPTQFVAVLMHKKSGAVLTKAMSRYSILYEFGELTEKPVLPPRQLNAEHFDLTLLKGEWLFPKQPSDLVTCVPLFHEQFENNQFLLKLVDLHILMSLPVSACLLRPHSLCSLCRHLCRQSLCPLRKRGTPKLN